MGPVAQHQRKSAIAHGFPGGGGVGDRHPDEKHFVVQKKGQCGCFHPPPEKVVQQRRRITYRAGDQLLNIGGVACFIQVECSSILDLPPAKLLVKISHPQKPLDRFTVSIFGHIELEAQLAVIGDKRDRNQLLEFAEVGAGDLRVREEMRVVRVQLVRKNGVAAEKVRVGVFGQTLGQIRGRIRAIVPIGIPQLRDRQKRAVSGIRRVIIQRGDERVSGFGSNRGDNPVVLFGPPFEKKRQVRVIVPLLTIHLEKCVLGMGVIAHMGRYGHVLDQVHLMPESLE